MLHISSTRVDWTRYFKEKLSSSVHKTCIIIIILIIRSIAIILSSCIFLFSSPSAGQPPHFLLYKHPLCLSLNSRNHGNSLKIKGRLELEPKHNGQSCCHIFVLHTRKFPATLQKHRPNATFPDPGCPYGSGWKWVRVPDPFPDSQSLTAIITQHLHSTGNTREKKRNGRCKSLHWATDWIGLHYGLPTSWC